MAVGPTTTAVEVGDTATPLYAADNSRKVAWIHNMGGATIYVGGADVTTTNGLPIPDGEKLPLYSGYEDGVSAAMGLYAIAAAAQTSPADTRILLVDSL